MRTFIAIELPLALQTHLATVQRQLQATLRRLSLADCFNWVAPEKIHLTLRFLGETDAQQMTQLARDLPALAQRLPPFALAVADVGAFPHFRRPNVLWLGLHGDLSTLQRMQQEIEGVVQRSGFAPENRTFSPHLTIARAQRNAIPAALGQAGQAIHSLAEKISAAKPATVAPIFPVTQIVHLRSELRPAGAHYTALSYYELRAEGSKG